MILHLRHALGSKPKGRPYWRPLEQITLVCAPSWILLQEARWALSPSLEHNCTTMICSSTLWRRVPSIWRLPVWWPGKPSSLEMLLSCPKVGHSSPHNLNYYGQWWKVWIGSAVWCDNWRCLILTVLRLRHLLFHCRSVFFTIKWYVISFFLRSGCIWNDHLLTLRLV